MPNQLRDSRKYINEYGDVKIVGDHELRVLRDTDVIPYAQTMRVFLYNTYY